MDFVHNSGLQNHSAHCGAVRGSTEKLVQFVFFVIHLFKGYSNGESI